MPQFTPAKAGSPKSVVRGKLTIRGGDKLISKLESISEDFTENAEAILKQGGKVIQKRASQTAPKGRTKELHKNIIVEGITGERFAVHSAAAGDVDVTRGKAIVGIGPDKQHFYGMFPELGTKHQPAQRWLQQAFDETKDRAEDVVIEELNRIVKKHTIAGL